MRRVAFNLISALSFLLLITAVAAWATSTIAMFGVRREHVRTVHFGPGEFMDDHAYAGNYVRGSKTMAGAPREAR